MTRSWVFTLGNPGQWYNLWDDLIVRDPSFTDRTFTNSQYVPNVVCEEQIQSPLANAGMLVTIAYDSKKEGGTELLAGSADLRRNNRNIFSLKQTWIKADTVGAVVNVTIAAV